ncbi:hypothetical protein [Streptomyces sp. NBC_01435]|uniref:hypothetical protein n=1 Tax=Streptomyces sp. NBC_01435 TaxID=2903865 RepID=UPI002E2F53D3|nr:hypothetical protein [Streptomyces sp. NBC_01435]
MASSAPKPVRAASAPRPGRPALALAVAGALLGLPLVSACGPSSSSSDGAANPPARGDTATTGGTGNTNGTGGTGGNTSGSGSGGTSWALSAPQTVAGHPQGQPPADMVRRFDDDTHKNAARLGVSGTPVRAYYDDRTDGAWIFYTGVTGSGFKPDRLHDILDQLPAVHDDGAGDRTTTSAIDAEPGPHGGRAICNTVLLRTELLVTAVSTCSWFTPTTAAGITLIPKTDGTSTKLGFTAADVAPIMRAVRAEVEVPRR